MNRRHHLWAGLALVLLFLVAGCANVTATPTPYPAEVDWATAVEILNTGNVEVAVQAHSLDITLIMKGGSEIRTVEPAIDAIFDEVKKCGQPCSQVLVATE
jgi:hypothetical protein